MDTKHQFLLEYFKSLREEINVRIQKNVNLWSLKITVAGFIFAFLGKSSMEDGGMAIPILYIVPWFVVIFDFLIFDNLLGIHNVANFIKHRIELTPPGSEAEGIINERFWEHLCGQCEQGGRILYIRHIIAMVLFAFLSAGVPWLIYWYLPTSTVQFPCLLNRVLVLSTVLVVVVEAILSIGFVWKRYSVEDNIKSRLKSSKNIDPKE